MSSAASPYTQVQDAVDEAKDGDVIEVCPGSYEHVTIVRKDLELRGENRDTTILDGGNLFTALMISDSDVTVSGLTLTGSQTLPGHGVTSFGAYSGSVVELSYVKVSGQENGSESYAKAIQTMDSDLTMSDVLVELNQTAGTLQEHIRGSLVATHCTWRENEAEVLILIASDTFFSNNLVYGNSGSTTYPTLLAFGSAAGEPDPLQTVVNNTVAQNDISWMAVAATGYDNWHFINNIVAGNGSTWGLDAPGVVVEYNDLWGHTSNLGPATSKGATMLEANPEFALPSVGDFTLAKSSPCIDAGDPDPGYNDPDGSRNDMGAFGGPEGDWAPPP
jgi:hypothetical protein